MQMSSCCAIIEQHQCSGPSTISYREQIEKLSSTDNTGLNNKYNPKLNTKVALSYINISIELLA